VQYSIMKYSDVDVGNRIDAEYFQLPSLHIKAIIEWLDKQTRAMPHPISPA